MSEAKVCTWCKEEKSIDCFYNDKSKNDGKQYICKCCSKIKVKEYQKENKEKIRIYDYNRYHLLTPEEKTIKFSKSYKIRNKNRFKETGYYKTEKYKEKQRIKGRDCIKTKARNLLNYNIHKGLVEKPKNCPICNDKDVIIHGHHEDYNKPLDVIWCCIKCHNIIHKKQTV